jgi:hypothetical protein
MNDPDLDDRIRRALRVEPSADQLARLEAYWRSQSSARKRRRWPLVVAAAVFIAAGLGAWWIAHLPSEMQRPAIASDHPQPPPRRVRPRPVEVHEPPPVTHPLQIAVASPREATQYEQLLFAVQTGNMVRQADKPDAAAIAATAEAIEKRDGIGGLLSTAQDASDRNLRSAAYDRLLTQQQGDQHLQAYLSLVANERSRVEALAAITRAKDQPVDELLNVLVADDRSTRLAAALALSRINTPEVADKLIARVTSPEPSSEAWIALFACRNETVDRFLAAAAQHPRLLGHLNYARLQWTQLMQ